jgi:radical SAM superfamily enzyme YgiQ (UPF0313 family)
MGLIQLAAVIESKGHHVTIIDAGALNLRAADIPPLLEETDVLGLTAMTPTASRAIEIAAEVKNSRPELPVILGGPHATLLPYETMEVTQDIDIIVRGEAEESFVTLLRAIEKNGSVEDVPGIIWEKDGQFVENEAAPYIEDLDALPFLAYHLIPMDKYRPHPPHGRAFPFAVLITSRGCPYNCAYCSKPVFGRKFRAQSPGRVVDEIVDLQSRYGVREIAFYDDVFTLDKKRAYAISEEIVRRGLKVTWSCETRVNLVDKELLAVMAKAGCYSISYGLESGNQTILDTINKNTTLEEAEEAVRYTREAGIHPIGYFMIGSPGETPETIKQTIALAKKLKLGFAQFSITTPFPGTELYNLYLEAGGSGDIPWEDYIYAGSGEGSAPIFESDALKRDDIVAWQKQAYRDFYLRPSYIWQRILSCKSFGDIKVNLNGLSMLIGSIRSAKKGKA